MGTHYYAVLFHENLFNEANDEESFRATFDFFDEFPITRKPSLHEIRDAILQHTDGYEITRDIWSETQLDFYMEKRDPQLLDYVEWQVSQEEIDRGVLSLDRAYSDRYPAILATLAEQIGPIGYFNASTMALGIINSKANLAEAVAIAHGSVGVVTIACGNFQELFHQLCTNYLEHDDPEHPLCYCHLPRGTVYLRKKAGTISVVFGGFILPDYLAKTPTDQNRNTMLLTVLNKFGFHQVMAMEWRAHLAPITTRNFITHVTQEKELE